MPKLRLWNRSSPRLRPTRASEPASLRSLSTCLIRSKKRVAFATFPNHMAFFNQTRHLTAMTNPDRNPQESRNDPAPPHSADQRRHFQPSSTAEPTAIAATTTSNSDYSHSITPNSLWPDEPKDHQTPRVPMKPKLNSPKWGEHGRR